MQATEQLTSNEKHDGKMNFQPAPDSQPYGEINAGKWFKRVGRPLVRHLADVVQMSLFYTLSALQAAVGIALMMLCVFIDATHLTNDGGQKCLPVYLTSGNFDMSICRCAAIMQVIMAPHPACVCAGIGPPGHCLVSCPSWAKDTLLQSLTQVHFENAVTRLSSRPWKS